MPTTLEDNDKDGFGIKCSLAEELLDGFSVLFFTVIEAILCNHSNVHSLPPPPTTIPAAVVPDA